MVLAEALEHRLPYQGALPVILGGFEEDLPYKGAPPTILGD